MGLHLHTRQSNNKAFISVSGEISGSAITQLDAVIRHFRSRGCRHITVEVKPLTASEAVVKAAEAVVLSCENEFIAIR